MSPETRALAAPLLVLKLLTVGLMLIGGKLLPGAVNLDLWVGLSEASFGHPPEAPFNLANRLGSWDAGHYFWIAELGYRPDGRELAFPPLWPMLIRALNGLTGSSLVSGLALANLLSWVAMLLFHEWMLGRYGAQAARTGLLLYLAFPTAILMSFAYSEPLFLVLVLGGFLAIDRNKLLVAAGLFLLLPLTRMVGVMVLLPLFVIWWRRGRVPKELVLPLAPLLGLGLYMAFMFQVAGDPLAGIEAQSGYVAGTSVGDVFNPFQLFGDLMAWDRWHGVRDSRLDRLFFLGALAVAAWQARRWREEPELLLYALLFLLVPALTVHFVAYGRYLLAVFPLFMTAGLAFSHERARPWLIALVPLSLLLQGVFLLRQLNHHWVG